MGIGLRTGTGISGGIEIKMELEEPEVAVERCMEGGDKRQKLCFVCFTY